MNPFEKSSPKTINALLIFLIVATFLVIFLTCYRSLLVIDTDEFWEIHSYQVSASLDVLISDLENIETSQRGYVITGQERFLGPYNTYLPDVNVTFQKLKEMTKDNPAQQQSLSQVKPLIDAKIADLKNNISLRKNAGFNAAKTDVLTINGKRIMDSIRTIVKDMQAEESRLLALRSKDLEQINSTTESIILWGCLMGFLFYLLVNFVINRFVIGEIVQKPLLEREQRALAEALRANNEMEAFSYSVAHDLRAPLRAINGYTKILEEDYGSKFDAEGKRIAAAIRGNSVQMGKLIDDLLSFSRLGRKEIVKSPVAMDILVDAILKELKGSIPPGRNVEFNIGTLPVVKADLDVMRAVWTNLLSNAIKFTGNKENAVIEVGGSSDDHFTTYYIKDNGTGFDMKYIDKLFGVFQRLHSTAEFEGNGVGLAIIKRGVERHGGKVWVEAKVDEGATFYFTLPKV